MQEIQDVPTLLTDTDRSFPMRCSCQVSFRAALVLAAGLLPVAGCNRGHSADVVATVNGHAIMRADLDKAYRTQLGDSPQQQPLSQEQADSLRLNVLRTLIDQEIVEQRAAKMNLTATKGEVDAKFDDLKHALRQNLTIGKLLNKEINSKITVTDADVANFYNQNKAGFNLRETPFHLAQIQVTDIPSPQPGNLQNSKATNDVDAKRKIQALKNRLDSGEDFGTLAMNFSEDPETAPNGGDMGFVGESQMQHADPAVFAAITKLKAGEVTEILPLLDGQSKKPVGYAIYKLLSRDPPGQRDLNDPRVQQAIRQQLREGRSQLLKAAYLEMVHDQAKVENFFAEQIFRNDAH